MPLLLNRTTNFFLQQKETRYLHTRIIEMSPKNKFNTQKNHVAKFQ